MSTAVITVEIFAATVSNGFLCRTKCREHIPKRHLDFENPITGKVFDVTSDRITGESRPEIMATFNQEYGTGKNKADNFPKMGRKTANIEQEIAQAVAAEMREKERQFEAQKEQRYFDTTNRATYDKKDLS